MESDLISILTPFKNSAQFLPECIKSIQSQSYKNWELIIIDDDSNDNSFDIVKSFATDSRIKLFKNPGKGIIEALRFGFSKSKGKFITRMDSDDFMSSTKLEVMRNQLVEYGTKHVALGLVKYFRADGINEGYYNYEQWLNSLTKLGTNYSEIYKECVIPSPCWMLHREDLIACEAFKPNRYPEDYDLAFRFYKYNFSCIPSNHLLHYWRDYSTRTSRTHEHYTDNHFLSLKTYYFLQLNYNSNRPLTIWGAGSKGKVLAKLLIKNNIEFYWICNNPKKIGKEIYNQKLLSVSYLETLENPQSIITVANSKSQEHIRSIFDKLKLLPMKDYFFFC